MWAMMANAVEWQKQKITLHTNMPTEMCDEAELIATFTGPYNGPYKGLETVQRSTVALTKVQCQL